jgi:DNA-binding FadR family transcriptional regulator
VSAGRTQQTVSELRGLIVSGELSDGESLGREADLMARFGASRPSVREALRILETEGLIEVARGVLGGVFVRTPDKRITARTAAMVLRARNVSLADVLEARALLEPLAAQAIATRRRGRRGVVAELVALIDDEQAAIDDAHDFGVANVAFHEALVALSGNDTLAVIAETLNEIVASTVISFSQGDDTLGSKSTRARDLQSQRRLIEFLNAGDADGAQAHWRAHMMTLRRVVLNTNASAAVALLHDLD